MKNHRRLLFWLSFFAMAGVVAVIPEWLDGDAPDAEPLVAPVVRPAAPPEAALSGPAAPLAALRNAPASDADADADAEEVDGPVTIAAAPQGLSSLFTARTWVLPAPPPPPAPPPSLEPPPPPSAPPLPFRLLGRLDDATTVKAFLQKGELVYTVGVGEVIDGTWRVDSIQAGQVGLWYLPLSIPQTLTAGGEP